MYHTYPALPPTWSFRYQFAQSAFFKQLFDLRPETIASTVAAHRMGLGELDLTRMRVVGG